MGFSKLKHQGAAKYNRALKALVKAKKEYASLEVKKESSQCRTQFIMSGNLRPAMIANRACISNKRIVITYEFCLMQAIHQTLETDASRTALAL